jgi:hypothetical protein
MRHLCLLEIVWTRSSRCRDALKRAGPGRERHSRDLVASDTSIKAALEPMKLAERIGKGCCNLGDRFAVQTLSLDQRGTRRRIPEGSFKVPNGLNVVVGTLPTGGCPGEYLRLAVI